MINWPHCIGSVIKLSIIVAAPSEAKPLSSQQSNTRKKRGIGQSPTILQGQDADDLKTSSGP